ncbi:MAG: Ig-like domain-containing protein, partial [Clostridia bacterium]
IDRKQDILYVAGSSDLAYHRTSDYQRLGEAAEMYGGGYEYPDPLQLDQNNLYYGYYRYDTKDMKKHIKQYPEPVLYAKEKYVFSKESVYDRDTAAKVAILPEVIDHALMNEAGEIFLYQKESGTISKYRSIGDMKNSGPVLTIDTPEITMQPSDKFWLHVTATFPDGTVRDVSKEIIWESSDYRVRVNNQYYGVFVKAFDECHAILTGTYKGQVVSATVDVIPEQASVTKLQIVPESLKGKVGKSIEAKVIATYSDDSEQDVTYKVDWSSSGFSIVQPFGAKLLPLKEGTATVIATYQDVRTNAQLNVVSQSKVEALIASEKSLNMDAGEVKKLKVTAKWDDGNREDVTSRAVWSSADTEVASVSDDGIVTANSNGRTVITANYDGMSVQIDVAVSGQKQLDFLEVTKNNLSLKIGEKRNLLVTAVYKGGAKEDVTEQAQWDVEDTKIAEVQKGMITAKSKGTTQVRVQFKDKTATIKVKVVGIKKLKFSKTSYKLKPGDQVELNVSAVYDDNSTTDVTDKVEFELSNPRIMQIKGSTLVAVAGGKGNVVAKFAGNSGKANVSVSGGLFLEGNFTDSAIHPSKPIVYMVDKTNRRVISYDYKTKQLNTISMEKMPERLLLSGDDLYVTLLTQEHSSYWWDEEQTGGIAVLNPMTLKIKDIMEINVDPFDIAADQDYLYVSSGSGQWTKLLSYSKASKEQIGESSIRQMSYIELNPILNRIYTVDTDTSPRDISAYPVKSGEIGKKLDSPYHGDYEMSPYFELSPDGNYLFNGAGTIFQTTNDRHDLEYVDSLGLEFVAASFQLKNNKFYVGNESEIYEYEYDSFDQLETYTVKGEVRYVFARDGQLIAVVKTGTNGDLEQYQIEILKLK